jgi:hypothetical protein
MMGNVLTNYQLDEAQLRAALEDRPHTVGALLDAVAGTHAARRGAQRWVEQTPTHILNAADIRREWPDARIIRLLRDPRGVVASYLKVPFGPDTAVGAAYLWQMHDDAARATLDDDPGATVVRYETLLANPEGEVRRISAFIGEAYEPAMLAATLDRPNYKANTAVDATRADAWHRELSPQDQERVTMICAVGMERHGYPGARRAIQTVLVHPYDEYLSQSRELLESAADRRIALRPIGSESDVDNDRPILFWGRRRRLRWSDSPVGSERRSLPQWARAIARARLRQRPILWVAAGTQRPPNKSIAERAGDALAMVAVPRAGQPDALGRLVPEAGGAAATEGTSAA